MVQMTAYCPGQDLAFKVMKLPFIMLMKRNISGPSFKFELLKSLYQNTKYTIYKQS